VKRALLFFSVFLALSSLCALAQAGGFPYITAVQGPGNLIKAVPLAPVVVCGFPATGGTPCTNTITTYTDPTASVACTAGSPVISPGTSTCSATSDTAGNFEIFVNTSVNSAYTYYFKAGATWNGPFAVAEGSGGGGGPTQFNGTPTGSCTAGQTAVDTTTGKYYSCLSGAWVLVGPGAAGTSNFGTVLAGTNTGQLLGVGNGSTLTPSGTGVINANQANGLAFGDFATQNAETPPAIGTTTPAPSISGTTVIVGNGTSAAPSLTFANAPDLGFFPGTAGQTYAITTASRVSGVTTLTFAANVLPGLSGPATFTVTGVSDTSFNGTFQTTSSTGTTLVYSQALSNASSSGGTAQFWMLIQAGFGIAFNRLKSTSNGSASRGSIQLGPTDAVNHGCSSCSPSVATGLGTTDQNLIAGQGSSGPAKVGDYQGIKIYGPLITTLGPSTSPVCPNGTNNALTTVGCTGGGGGGSGTVNNAAQYAAPYYSSAGSTNVLSGLAAPTSPNNVVQVLTSTPSSGAATAPAYALPGLAARAVSAATDTISSSDCNPTQLIYTFSGTVAETLPTAATLAVASCFLTLYIPPASSTTSVTVTPTTWTINGAASLLISKGQRVSISVDPASATNWLAFAAPSVDDCGTTSTCAATPKAAGLMVRGSVAFPTATTVTVTALPFTSASSYSCTAGDVTTAAGVINATTYTSGSSVTFTETNGTNTDTMRYVCAGW
jgi:hypothetical protein